MSLSNQFPQVKLISIRERVRHNQHFPYSVDVQYGTLIFRNLRYSKDGQLRMPLTLSIKPGTTESLPVGAVVFIDSHAFFSFQREVSEQAARAIERGEVGNV
jgi:hypothetical protein